MIEICFYQIVICYNCYLGIKENEIINTKNTDDIENEMPLVEDTLGLTLESISGEEKSDEPVISQTFTVSEKEIDPILEISTEATLVKENSNSTTYSEIDANILTENKEQSSLSNENILLIPTQTNSCPSRFGCNSIS